MSEKYFYEWIGPTGYTPGYGLTTPGKKFTKEHGAKLFKEGLVKPIEDTATTKKRGKL